MSSPEPPGPGGENPYGAPGPQPQPPPYQQPQGFQQGFQQQFQPPYGQPPPDGYTWPAPGPPPHPQATTSLVLSIIALVGIVFCGGLTLLISPFAWVLGSRTVREIDANPNLYSGRGIAFAGKVMGIVGTVLLLVGAVVIAIFTAWVISLGD